MYERVAMSGRPAEAGEQLGVCMKRDLASEMSMSERERQYMRWFNLLNAIGCISLLRNTVVRIIYI